MKSKHLLYLLALSSFLFAASLQAAIPLDKVGSYTGTLTWVGATLDTPAQTIKVNLTAAVDQNGSIDFFHNGGQYFGQSQMALGIYHGIAGFNIEGINVDVGKVTVSKKSLTFNAFGYEVKNGIYNTETLTIILKKAKEKK